jgi:leucyl/phenylalanyl-tRNA--protein transferase
MFHKVTNASKVALVHLGLWLNDGQGRMIDSQWMTEHLSSMGAVEISRAQYCDLLASKSDIPPPVPPV